MNYKLTFAEMVDRLSILLLKYSFGDKSVSGDIDKLCHDIDLVIKEKNIQLDGIRIGDLCNIAIANSMVWHKKDEPLTRSKLEQCQWLNNDFKNTILNIISCELQEPVRKFEG